MADAPARTTGRRRLRRWILRLGIGLLVLLLVLLIVLELVRRSGLTRSLIADTITAQTGIQTEVDHARLGLTGRTVVEGIRLTLPMADEPVARVERIDVRHSNLLQILTSFGVTVRSIAIDEPTIRVETDEDGRLSVEHLITRLGLLGGASSEGGSNAPPRIPEIELTNGSVVLALEGPPQTFPFSANAASDRGVLTVDADAPGLLEMDGTAAIGADWQHRATILLDTTTEPGAALFSAIGIDPTGIDGNAEWRGRAVRNGLRGTLTLDTAINQTETLSGTLDIETDGTTHRVEARGLDLSAAGTDARVASGTIALTDQSVTIERLLVQQAELTGELNGTIDLARASARVTLDAVGTLAGYETRQTVEVNATSVANRVDVRCLLRGEADAESGLAIENDLLAELEFTSLRAFRGTLRAPRLEIERNNRPRDLDDLVIHAISDGSELAFSAEEIPHTEAGSMSGTFEYDTSGWNVLLDLADAQFHEDDPLATLRLLARGESAVIRSWELEGHAGTHQFDGSGSYILAANNPLEGAFAITSQLGTPGDAERVLEGSVSVSLRLAGCLEPFQVTAHAMLDATNTLVEGTTVCTEPIEGTATFDERGAQFVADPFDLFGGECTLTITRDGDGTVDLTLGGDEVSLAGLLALVDGAPEIDGRLTGTLLAAGVTGPANEIIATGTGRIDDLRAPTLNADQASSTLRIQNGIATLSDIQLVQERPTLTGSVIYPLNSEAPATVDLHASDLRISAGTISAGIDGSIEGTVDLNNKDAVATLDATLRPRWQDRDLGVVAVQGAMQDRVVDLRQFSSEFAGGSIRGITTIPIDAWTDSTATVTIDGIEPRVLAELFPQLTEVGGRLSGELLVGPDRTAPVDAPLRVALELVTTEGRYRDIEVETVAIEAFVGPVRSLLRRADAHILGGIVRVHGTTNVHDGDRYIQLAGDVENIDLTGLLNSISEEPAPVRGRLTATFGGAGYVATPNRLVGEARVGIREADLLGVPVVSQMFSLMRGGFNAPSNGRGDAIVRIEDDDLSIPRLNYFNRGTDVQGSFEIDNLLSDDPTMIRGIAVGTARPLAEIDVFLVRELDSAINAIQSGGVAVEITGPLEAPETRVIPFERVLKTLKRSVGLGGS